MNRSIKITAAVTAGLLALASAAFFAGRSSVSSIDDKGSEGRQTTSKVQHVLPCPSNLTSALPPERISF